MKIDLANETLFWSRLGFELDPPQCDGSGNLIRLTDDISRFGKYHRKMAECGVRVHTSILHSGWVGPDRYDYSLTDRTLNVLFDAAPDVFYLPRVKLNAPMEWMKANPEELFVYYGGPSDLESIAAMIDTPLHDTLGFEAQNGYDIGNFKRPNVGGMISNQSFCSQKWLHDAGMALRKLMRHIADSPFGKQVIGYHIAYGACGECVLWGRPSGRFGDYGVVAKRAFHDYSERKNGTPLDIPSPEKRQNVTESTDAFLRKRPCDRAAVLYDQFMSEMNAGNIDFFAKIVKEESGGNALCGVFYGYMLECHNAAYTGHLAYQTLLRSPYVDFWAAPMSYYRREAGEPGGYLAPAQSVNLKKLWVDELDIRTYLSAGGFGAGRNFKETRTILWREFSKNLASASGFWWMDLGGGWFDSPEMYEEIRAIQECKKKLQKTPGKSVAEILVLVDPESGFISTEQEQFHHFMMKETLRELSLTGAPFDLYCISDCSEIPLKQYKMVLFLSCMKESSDLAEYFEDMFCINFYLNGSGNSEWLGVRLQETGRLFSAGKVVFHENAPWSGTLDIPQIPVPEIEISGGTVWASREDGRPFVCVKKKKIYSALPVLRYPQLRAFGEYAGVKFFAEAPCTVYADSRFTAYFPQNTPDEFCFIT